MHGSVRCSSFVSAAGLLVSLSCGSPGAVSGSSPQTATAPPQPATRATSTSAATDTKPRARVIAVRNVDENDRSVRIEFDNPTAQSCRFTRYELRWGKDTKEARPDDLVVPAHQIRDRWLRLHPADGDIGSFRADDATVAVETMCSPPP